jgi:hypothetical protein
MDMTKIQPTDSTPKAPESIAQLIAAFPRAFFPNHCDRRPLAIGIGDSLPPDLNTRQRVCFR